MKQEIITLVGRGRQRASSQLGGTPVPRSGLGRHIPMRGMRRLTACVLVLAVAMPLASTASAAQRGNRRDPDTASERDGPSAAPASEGRDGLGRDIKAFLASPLHWRRRDWFELAGAVGVIGVAYSADDRTREHFEQGATGVKPDTHDTADALPAFVLFAGTLVGAAATHDRDGIREARSMIEAAAFGTATSYVVKAAAGRARPYDTIDRSAWREGGDSFPSVHSAAAFAIGTVLAESGNDRYRWIRRFIGYGVALGTAYRRLDHRAHWGSDTVAGAVIGIASARFVLRRRDSGRRRFETAIVPTDGGFALVYAAALD